MISVLIFGVSFATLLQFFISYNHALVLKSREYQLSEQAREIAGVHSRVIGKEDFQRLLRLIALCPSDGSDQRRVQTVSAYFNLLGWTTKLFSWVRPAISDWIESERSGCAYFVAVILDRRIAHSRVLMAQQSSQPF